MSQIVVHKLRDGESPEGAWRKALNERLALTCKTIDACFDEEEATEYKDLRRVSFLAEETDRSADIGAPHLLPRGRAPWEATR